MNSSEKFLILVIGQLWPKYPHAQSQFVKIVFIDPINQNLSGSGRESKSLDAFIISQIGFLKSHCHSTLISSPLRISLIALKTNLTLQSLSPLGFSSSGLTVTSSTLGSQLRLMYLVNPPVSRESIYKGQCG